MERRSPTQFSLLEMLLGFALVTALCVFQLLMLRLDRRESGWPYYLSAKMLPYYFAASVVVGLAVGLRYAMRAAHHQQRSGWSLILWATLFALVNGIIVQSQNVSIWSCMMGMIAFTDIGAVLVMLGAEGQETSPTHRPRPGGFALGFHMIVMVSLIFYNIFLYMQAIKSLD